jgi:DNA-binding MarR family transcriptional regulator
VSRVTDVGVVPPTDDDMFRAVRSIVLAWERLRQYQSAIQNVGVSELIALGHLFHDGELTPGELSTRLGLSSGTMTALVDRLEGGGYAARTPNPDDRRSQLVRISEAGRATMGSIYAEYKESIHDTLAALPAHTRRAVVDTLLALAADIDTYSAALVVASDDESSAD